MYAGQTIRRNAAKIHVWNSIRPAAPYGEGDRGRVAEGLDDSQWLDSYRVVSGTDNIRSVDVLVTIADNDSSSSDDNAAADDEPVDLVLEILSIEMRDPTR